MDAGLNTVANDNRPAHFEKYIRNRLTALYPIGFKAAVNQDFVPSRILRVEQELSSHAYPHGVRQFAKLETAVALFLEILGMLNNHDSCASLRNGCDSRCALQYDVLGKQRFVQTVFTDVEFCGSLLITSTNLDIRWGQRGENLARCCSLVLHLLRHDTHHGSGIGEYSCVDLVLLLCGNQQGLDQECDTHHQNASIRSEEHTSELQSRQYLVCRLL